MFVVHSKLKEIIVYRLKGMQPHRSLFVLSANEGGLYVFSGLRESMTGEIFQLYINSCEADFFKKYSFENIEPFLKGFLEARYFMLRMFHIPFSVFFSGNDQSTAGLPMIINYSGNDILYA
jgi:hypothetical protein